MAVLELIRASLLTHLKTLISLSPFCKLSFHTSCFWNLCPHFIRPFFIHCCKLIHTEEFDIIPAMIVQCPHDCLVKALLNHVGLLVVDEIQNVVDSRYGKALVSSSRLVKD